MKLKKAYTLLYMPEDHGPSRQIRIHRWVILGSGGILAFLLMVSSLYFVGLRSGQSWLPGGSVLEKENRILSEELAGMDRTVGRLRAEMDEMYHMQSLVATAVNLQPLHAEEYAAGVGGRGRLDQTRVEVPGLTEALASEGQMTQLDKELSLMLRQARIQRQGYAAMLDTLETRADVRAHIPSIRPCDTGWLSSRFGFRNDPFTTRQKFHHGLDFSVPVGTEVRVTGDGLVTAVQHQRGLGRVIKVDHGGGVMTVYAHLDKTLVEKGDQVTRGSVVALSGNTGRSTAPHLHYEIRISGRSVNPISYILDSYASRD